MGAVPIEALVVEVLVVEVLVVEVLVVEEVFPAAFATGAGIVVVGARVVVEEDGAVVDGGCLAEGEAINGVGAPNEITGGVMGICGGCGCEEVGKVVAVAVAVAVGAEAVKISAEAELAMGCWRGAAVVVDGGEGKRIGAGAAAGVGATAALPATPEDDELV